MNILKKYIKEFLSMPSSTYSGGRSIRRSPLYQPIDQPNQMRVKNDEIPCAKDKDGNKLAVTVLIMSDDGKILSVSRKTDPTMLGMPGGKVDVGETAEYAASRELKEETGLNIENLRPVFSHKDKEYLCTTFIGKVYGEINTNEAGVIRWVEPRLFVDEKSSHYVVYNRLLFQKLGIKT